MRDKQVIFTSASEKNTPVDIDELMSDAVEVRESKTVMSLGQLKELVRKIVLK
jgi:hypothetical protein